MHILKNKLIALAALCIASTAQALPVGFKDSWMSMGELSKDWKEANLMYSFSHRDAIGLGTSNIRWNTLGAAPRSLNQTDLHYNRLLARWNTPDSQTNIFILAGLAQANSNFFSGSQLILQPGLQVDHETRRIYAALKWHGYYGKSLAATRTSVAGGFSFYPTEYDEWQPWFVVEVDKKGADFKSIDGNVEVTPYLRLIHKTLFIEAGSPQKKGKSQGLKVNFRYTF
jgi:hypothetical protein